MKTKQWLMARFCGFLIAICSTPLALASLVDMAEMGDWEGVEASLQSEDVNELQPDGMSALFWAVYYDETNSVKSLLNAGADANVQNRYGLTALMQASQNSNGEMIAMLLDAGANPNTMTLEGDTALMNASRAGTTLGVQALLDHGAEVDARDLYLGQTALSWAAAENYADVIKILVDNGADINAIGKALVFEGVDDGNLNSTYPDGGLTALHHASRENAINAINMLLSLGADPNILDPEGLSAVRIAAANYNLDLVKILIDNGADINEGLLVDVLDIKLKPRLRAGTSYNNKYTVVEMLDILFEMGVDVDSNPEFPLPKFGTGINGGFGGTSGQTALYLSVAGNHEDMIDLFLSKGADVNTLNNGNTALIASLKIIGGRRGGGGNDEDSGPFDFTLANRLLEHGADVNVATASGGTALHMAAALGKDEIVEFLIEQGIDLAVQDSSNRTALDIASGVKAVAIPGARFTPPAPPVHESTVALLSSEMGNAGVEILPYEAPPMEEESENSD
jgi:uncharacterized protein